MAPRIAVVRWAWMVALLFLLMGRAQAQNVRHEVSDSSSRRQFDLAAQKQGRGDWLQSPYEGSGTQVRLTFDAHNADITLMTPRAYDMNRLLAQARQIALTLDRPRADFILSEGTKTATVDMELNKYLRVRDKRTDFTLDITTLARALQHTDLPQPVVMGVETDDADTAFLQINGQQRSLQNFWYAAPAEISPATSLSFHAEIPWYAYPVAFLFLCLCCFPAIIPWQLARARAKEAGLPVPAPTPDPAEVQERYDRSRPQWLGMLPLLLPALLFLLGNPRRLLLSAFMVMPFSPRFLPLLMLIPMGISWLGCALFYRRQGKTIAAPLTPEQIEQQAMFRPMLFLLMPLMLLMPVLLFLPHYVPALSTPRFLQLRHFIGYGIIALGVSCIVLLPFFTHRATRKLRTVLTDGPWHDMVQGLAMHSGVTVKRVVLKQSSFANAYATAFGTVGLTTKLLETLEPDEVRAIVAHEIGHLKGHHPQKNLAVSLTVFLAIWGGWICLRVCLRHHVAENVNIALNMPFLFFILSNVAMMLTLGPWRRKHENDADFYAVRWTGDPELVIRALTKVHVVNAAPHRLKPSDEKMSDHPSLSRRIAAIRNAFPF